MPNGRSRIIYTRNPLGIGKAWRGKKCYDQITGFPYYEQNQTLDPYGNLVDGRNVAALDGDPEYGVTDREIG